MKQETRYKIAARFDIQKMIVREDGYENYTGERLSIDDSMDMGTAVDLVRALKLIERMHAALADDVAEAQGPVDGAGYGDPVVSALTAIRTAAGFLEEIGK